MPSDDPYLDEFPAFEIEPPKKGRRADADPALNERPAGVVSSKPSRASEILKIWERISQAGLAETTLRLGTHALLVALILFVAWALRAFYLRAQVQPTSNPPALAAARAEFLPTSSPTETLPDLPPLEANSTPLLGIVRYVSLHTDVPARARTDVITYTVEAGDTVFGVAKKFDLKPETILWGNQLVLGDNPHNLRPGQVLNILPVNGTYHRWSEGDGLNGVAKYFGVTPEDIIDFPGNHLDPETIGDYTNPNIAPGTWLIVPGGTREFVSWSAPEIPRDNPKVASVLGPGACSAVASGTVGIGAFIWPANHHYLSGFDYAPEANHRGIDIDGDLGDAVYAADGGVVVYAGWNNWGYGNLIVINHGNGWQTLYAHLSALNVGCGQSVGQGTVIGAFGSTGNSTGPHLHFEMMYKGGKVNPHDYLP